MKNAIFAVCIAFIASACRHPIEIIGQGDVMSASGNRDCLYADYQASQPNCTANEVDGEYLETYYPVATPGYIFSAWGNYCSKADGIDECSFNIPGKAIKDADLEQAPPLVAYFREQMSDDQVALLMGHSFFDPFSTRLPGQAALAGFENHQQHKFFSGGGGGAPIAFWNDKGSSNHKGIKRAMDSGNITLLGMTTYPNDFDYALSGYKNWIDYALKNNADFDVFIGMPWSTDPAAIELKAYQEGWDDYHRNEVHATIDILRDEYPGLDFYCIPYGQAGVALKKLFEAGKLTDITQLQGDWDTSVFTDDLGHPGKILIELGSLIWLRAVYGADLQNLDFGLSYNINMKNLADEILNKHDHRYDAP